MPAARNYLFEFEDLPWFPDTIRRSMVDYLSFFLRKTEFYKPILPLIAECLAHSNDQRIIDLCSGGGGPMQQLQKQLSQVMGKSIPIVLTDKFPNVAAYEQMVLLPNSNFSFIETSVDASQVPVNLKGVRTIFSAFHHFSPDFAKAVLKDAVANKTPIAIFDGGDKNLLTILGIILAHPVIFFFCTPFFRPFRFSRIIFTYLIPLIPFCTVWDGVISILRLHKPKSMLQMVKEINATDYHWMAGTKKHPLGFHIAYLIGYPKNNEL